MSELSAGGLTVYKMMEVGRKQKKTKGRKERKTKTKKTKKSQNNEFLNPIVGIFTEQPC